MTQAEMFTRAIKFQNQYIAIDTAFVGGGWTEDSKIGKVFSQFGGDYPGGLNECKELARFVKDKAGSLSDRGALIKARNDYLNDLEKAGNDANAELAKNSDQEINQAEAAVAAAKKKTKTAKFKRNGNRLLNILGLAMIAIALLSGSLAIFAPLINGVAALVGGLSTATAVTLGLGIWYHWPDKKKRQEWWKKKGKNKLSGKDAQDALEAALKNEKTAEKELSNKRNARKAAEKEATKKAAEFESETNIILNNEFNPKARKEIDKLEAKWHDLLVQSEASFEKHDWAVSDGRKWFKFAVSSVERDFVQGKITDSNYGSVLAEIDSNFGIGAMFDPDVTTPPTYDKFNRRGLIGSVATEAEETEEAFWA